MMQVTLFQQSVLYLAVVADLCIYQGQYTLISISVNVPVLADQEREREKI